MDLEQFYNEIKTDKEKFNLWDFPVLNLLEKRKETLEIGSGSGFFAAHITKCDIPVTCVDLSDYYINKCRDRGLSVFKVNIEKEPLPFHNEMFYQVVMVEVIEHLFNPFHVLKEISRVLLPNGKLILSTHNALNIIMRILFLTGNINPTSNVSHPGRGEHIRLYSHKILSNVLQQAGFNIVSYHSWFYIPILNRYIFPPKLLRYLLSQHILVIAQKNA